MTSWVLVHSPLLGPWSWSRVAELLHAEVPDLRPTLGIDHDFAATQARLAADHSPPGSSVWLGGHSGAGPLLALVARRLTASGVRVDGTVFVDARLPHPGVTRRDTFPVELATQLDALTDDGWLPPWPLWWPRDALVELVPHAFMRQALQQDSPRLPAALFDEVLPDAPNAPAPRYLRLSAAYDDEADQAEKYGWPVTRLDLDHLSILTRPDDVAQAMTRLVQQ